MIDNCPVRRAYLSVIFGQPDFFPLPLERTLRRNSPQGFTGKLMPVSFISYVELWRGDVLSGKVMIGLGCPYACVSGSAWNRLWGAVDNLARSGPVWRPTDFGRIPSGGQS